MNKSQNGIAHLGLLLLVLIAAVIGYAGYTVYQNRADNTGPALSSTPTNQAINSSADLDKATSTLNNQNIDSDLDPSQMDSDINSLL